MISIAGAYWLKKSEYCAWTVALIGVSHTGAMFYQDELGAWKAITSGAHIKGTA